MMKKIKILLCLASFLMACIACDEIGDIDNVIVTTEPLEEPSGPSVVWEVKGTGNEFPAEGGTLTFEVQCSGDWTVSCPSWCTYEITQDKTKAILTAAANNTGALLSGSVTFSCTGQSNVFVFTITQKTQTEQTTEDVPAPDDNVPPSR